MFDATILYIYCSIKMNLVTSLNVPLFRKRGGSVDNLLDDLDDGEQLVKRKHGRSKLSGESKKKSLSTKNLTGVGSAKKTSDAV